MQADAMSDLSDDEWALGVEREMRSLKPGETVERDGIVIFCTPHNLRGAMRAADYHALEYEPGQEPGAPTFTVTW